jgi:hypothetical protein
VKVARPLRDARLMETIEAMDRLCSQRKAPGAFQVEFHYDQKGELAARRVSGIKLEFDGAVDASLLTLD